MQLVQERTLGTDQIVAVADQYATEMVEALSRIQSTAELQEAMAGMLISFLSEVLSMVTANV
jgi:hypothetical protein